MADVRQREESFTLYEGGIQRMFHAVDGHPDDHRNRADDGDRDPDAAGIDRTAGWRRRVHGLGIEHRHLVFQ